MVPRRGEVDRGRRPWRFGGAGELLIDGLRGFLQHVFQAWPAVVRHAAVPAAHIKRRSAAKIAPSPNIGGQEGDAPSSPHEVEELKAKIRMLEATLHGHDSDDESMRT